MKASGPALARSSLFLAVAVFVSACISPGDIINPVFGCAKVNPEALKHVNWTRVPEINVRIRHDEFSPMVIRMRQGWPYVFRLRNRDDAGHTFSAGDFFRRVAIIQKSIGGEVEENPCFGSIWVPPRQTVELRLVAVVDGRYEFEDNPVYIFGGFVDGPNGVIIIEERRPRI